MSESKIRRLLTDHLIDSLRQPDTTLKYPVIPNGMVVDQIMTTNYMSPHIIPAPADDAALSGDLTVYKGIYQITLRATSDVDGNMIVDMNEPLDEMVDTVRQAFKANMRFTDTEGFTVQVASALAVTEARKDQKEQWWTLHTWFNYWAESN